MAKVAQLVPAFDAADRAQLVPAWRESTISVVAAIDGGNVDADLVTIDNTDPTQPIITLDVRAASISGLGWWNVVVQLTGANGKRPVFRVNRATNISPSTTPPTSWLPAWTADTTDHTSWIRASTRSNVGGSTGYYEWQFDAAFDADTVIVAMEPMGRVSDAHALAAELLAETFCSPAPSADVSGVFHTSPTESDEDGRAIGGHNMYALELDWGGSTNDGGPKRVAVIGAQIHALGEACSWISFRFFLDWLLNSSDAKAIALRANWKFYLYFAITPNGLYGGHRRWNYRVSTDPNRDWATTTLSEITALKSAINTDTAAAARFDAQFVFHAGYTTTNPARAYFTPEDESSGTRGPVIQALGNLIGGYLSSTMLFDSSGTYNTAPWWAKTQKGVRCYADIEVPALGSTALSAYQVLGEAWAKSLADLDAAGNFWVELAVANGAHAHSAENLDLTGATILIVADGGHAHTVEALTLTQLHELALADGSHAHSVENLVLAGAGTLDVAAGMHGHTADGMTLTQLHVLLMSDAAHAHAADVLNLSGAADLVLADGGHTHQAQGLTLTQAHALAVANAAHAHGAEELNLSGAYVLAIANAVHEQLAGTPAFTQQHILVVSDALHDHFAQQVAYGNVLTTTDARVLIVPLEERVLVIARAERVLH